ncbi:helix-turn-helix domain-containing protein [Sphingobacterium sp. ML3W]|uniref:hybrid sensor histidine kinase/response regulator transcription factor n=1 Tax=Sphingobacterium sp. ML3W TaxID=1538644 RepID=UPI00249BF2EC|nr:hybrid sensor histidine kinase/response regulator transcription factor [Sphingobacterium sp. ML3W]WFA80756.1 helix-turn-helix domain-containing protein [Sphingobacterium sp. ML3W]
MQQLNSFLHFTLSIFLFILLGQPEAFSQDNTYAFKTLTSDQGLIHNHVNCALRDKYNYLWFGTESGLSRFDGQQFTNFRYSAGKGSGLSANVISGIFDGPEGNIWIRTSSQMNIYNQRSGKIIQELDSVLTNLRLPVKDVYTIRALDEHNFVLLYSDRTLLLYDSQKKSYRTVPQLSKDSRITDVIEGRGQAIWLIYENGLLGLVDTKSLKSRQTIQLPIGIKSVNFNLFADNEGDLWIYSKDIPIGVYNLEVKSWSTRHLERELSNPFVGNVTQDDAGLIWLGTDHGGINVYNKKNQRIEIIDHDGYDLRSLPYNSITCLYKDHSGIIWAGTYKGGISYYHPNLLLFPLVKNHSGLPKSLPYDDVNKFVEDKKGNLWIGTNGGGLLYYDSTKKTFTQYLHDPGDPNSLSSNVIVSLLLDAEGLLWIGTYRGGMCRFDGKNFKVFHRDAGPGKLNDDSVWEIYTDSFNRFWVGTLSTGLYQFDKKTEHFSKTYNTGGETIKNSYISVIFEDSKKRLWIGTATGLVVLNPDGKVKNITSSSSPIKLLNDLIYDVKEDKKGRIWVATQEGLHIIAGDKISYLTEQDGLGDDAILALLTDYQGNIWASSNKGLSKIVETGSPEKFIIRNFTQELGLQGNVFNENAALTLRDGRLVFGGPKGFNFIDPAKIRAEHTLVLPVLSNLYLFNKQIAVGEEFSGRVIYDQSLQNLKELNLSYNLNALSVELSTFDYLQQHMGFYQYQLLGLSDEWFDFEPGTMRASFTNLDSRKYRLYIRQAIGSNNWSERVLLLTIDIQPPFWRSNWAFVLYATVVLTLLWAFYYWTKLRVKTRNQLYLAKEQALQAKELDAMKTRFFTNISHEFRTPISLILTPAQQLLDEEQDASKKTDLTLIKKNADRLLKLVNQLLDFRKLEKSELERNEEYGDLMEFIRQQLSSFVGLAQLNQIRFQVHIAPEGQAGWFDKHKLESILHNLVSNAIKFSPTAGEVVCRVELTAGEKGQVLHIEIQNSGAPIPESLQSRVFERYFQLEVPNGKLNQGTGIGLSIVKDYIEFLGGNIELTSNPEWTTFTVNLPIQHSEMIIEPQKNGHSDKPCILVVEDDVDFLLYLERTLQTDYIIFTSATVAEAKACLLKQKVDLVVTDLNLPVESGLDLCVHIKKQAKLTYIPVLIVTAVVNQQLAVEALQAGASDYINKPFHIGLLRSKIAQILSQQQNLVKRYKKQIQVNLSQPEIESADEQFIRALVREIEQDLSDSTLSVELLAKRLHITRVGLYKKVLAITGYSPMEYIRHIRLKRAMHLVQNSKLSMAEIAYEVGFGNPKQFSKYFKSAFGNLPSFYRKKL